MRRQFKKEDRHFLMGLVVFAIANIILYFGHGISSDNATVFAFHYQYGLISRGFLGTCYYVLNEMVPWNLYTYDSVYIFSGIMTVFYYITLFCFFSFILRKTDEKSIHYQRCLIFFLSVFAFSMYLKNENFGRLDIYLIILSLVCIYFILQEKCLWMIPILCAVSTCLHHGFLFMNANAILVLLFYRALQSEGKKRNRYIFTLIVTCVVVGGLFFYFEFWSHGQGEYIYDSVVTLSKQISKTGIEFNENLIQHEILGQGVFSDEWQLHLINYKEIPFLIIFFLPYLILGYIFFSGLIRDGERIRKICYGVLPLGAFAVLPEAILKVDYGRYLFQVVFYFTIVIMSLIALGDDYIIAHMKELKNIVYSRTDLPMMLLVYPIVFMPLYDVVTSYIIDDIAVKFFTLIR